MTDKDRAPKIKSSYELALERMERDGVERPETLSDEARTRIAEVRNQAEAKLAELEILYRDRLAKIGDREALQAEEDDYLRDRRRLEEDRDRKVERIRSE
jgi:hypothetical protein